MFHRLRTAFISDIHLGTRGCRAEALLAFLREVEVDTLYLVGDIVDLWALRRSVHWPAAHAEVVRSLIAMSRRGTRVVYVPGNHDGDVREFAGLFVGQVEIRRQLVHETAAGQRLLVLHGDEFDHAVKIHPWVARFGSHAYDFVLALHHRLNGLRQRLGYPYWSLAGFVKQHVRDARAYIDRFEQAAAREARRRGLDGIVCGHIHRPGIRRIDGVLYANDGDWVENCSTLVEDRDGRLALWRWEAERPARLPRPAAAALDEAA
ncbi:MAG: UDP-2,3-diacylglucosamine diphosphatase [Steroidobacteraceae bacterium]